VSDDLSTSELEQVAELLRKGLQRGDAAAAVWLTPEQFDQMFTAGCSPGASKAQRGFAQLVIDAENQCKARWISAAASSKSSYGPLSLLQLRFKSTWGKDAKPAPEAIPNNIIDWDAALQELLAQDDSPLHKLLEKHGWSRKR
jgi:hypothetical protein